MIREIIRPVSDTYSIHIPEEYINREVEILVLPFNSGGKTRNISNNTIIAKTSGILRSKKVIPEKWQQEIRGEWENRF